MYRDSEHNIVLAKLMNIITQNFSHEIIKMNGDGESLLRIIGRSDLIDQYQDIIIKEYIYNGYSNPHGGFNPGYFLSEVANIVSDNEEVLGEFLKEIFNRITLIENEELLSEIKHLLEIIGYDLKEISPKSNDYTTGIYKLNYYQEGLGERQRDVSYLENKLLDDNLLKNYNSMIENYSNSNYENCLDSSRRLLELTFTKSEETGDFNKAVISFTKEESPNGESETPKKSKPGIFKFWLSHHKGFNRSRLIITFYSMLSGLGVHGEEEMSKEDALWSIRMTEDILIWFYQTRDGR